MKTLICVAIAFFAATVFGGEARALTASPARAAITAGHSAAKLASDIETSRRHGGPFSNWCAWNCHPVPHCYNGKCLGRYGYSHFAYDEDLPFCYHYDRDASPIDNDDAFVYRYTGAPVMRAFERIY
ncbi:MAG: hypothetical protein WA265_06440 [Rhodomicrobium sp.]